MVRRELFEACDRGQRRGASAHRNGPDVIETRKRITDRDGRLVTSVGHHPTRA
jgi:hypothetical protein